MDKIQKNITSLDIIFWGFSTFVTTTFFYVFIPTISINFIGIWILSIIFLFIPILPNLLNSMDYGPLSKKSIFILKIIAGIISLLLSSYVVTTTAFLHSNEYKNLLGEVKISEFTKDITPVNSSQIRIVDEKMAKKLGEKRLGQDPGLGSRVELGDFNIQQVNGKLYWIAPLLHNGFFRWLNYKNEGTNGYVKVSAINPDDVSLVQEINKNKIYIKYQPNAYFNQNLERYIYFNGYITKGLTDFSFEIDDEGNPYWVITLYEKKVGFSGNNAIGVVIVNPQNGAIEEFSIKKAPKWVDLIQPENFINKQIDNWGEYTHGFWNSIFAKKDILEPSSNELRLVYGENGKSYWYSGITSTGNDKSNVGFLLVDTRTKETFRYEISGATEDAAQSSAEGLVQQYGYKASNFIPYNVAGNVTYIGALKDSEGLVKGVAAINMENYAIGGWGNNVNDAIRSYKQALASRGNSNLNIGGVVSGKTVEGKVLRFASDNKNGNTSYFFTIEGNDGYIFTANSNLDQKIPLTKIGDKIKVKFTFSGNYLVDIESFQNFDINLKSTEK